MSTSAYTRILVVILAALALAACPGKKGKKPDETPAVYYVSPAGSDGNPGTRSSPFKTISYAVRVATRSGTTVQVDPGTYNVANSETFPITVPAGVLLIGNETSKGGGTSIVGGGGQAPGATAGFGVAILPRAGSTIAGFTITNDNPALSGRYGLFLNNSSVTLRNNTVTGATHKVGIYVDASTDHVIARIQLGKRHLRLLRLRDDRRNPGGPDVEPLCRRYPLRERLHWRGYESRNAGLAVQDNHQGDERGDERRDGSGCPWDLQQLGSEHPRGLSDHGPGWRAADRR